MRGGGGGIYRGDHFQNIYWFGGHFQIRDRYQGGKVVVFTSTGWWGWGGGGAISQSVKFTGGSILKKSLDEVGVGGSV